MVLAVAIAVTAVVAARRRYWRAAWALIANGIAAGLLNRLLKLTFARDRPALDPVIPLPESHSFPSGHAMSALAVYGAIAAVVIALAPRARAAVLAVTVPLVLAIGLSRVYLGVHWPLDVLAGFAAAVPVLAATLLLLRAPPARPRPAARAGTDEELRSRGIVQPSTGILPDGPPRSTSPEDVSINGVKEVPSRSR